MEHRSDPFGIDRELIRVIVGGAWRRRVAKNLVGIFDDDRIAVGPAGGGDRRGDDGRLRAQAVLPRLDNVGAELIEQKEADRQDEQPAQVEQHYPARERGGEDRLGPATHDPEP